MKYILLLLSLFIIPEISHSQDQSDSFLNQILSETEITIMPTSVRLWGRTTGYTSVGVSYKKVSLYYFHKTGNPNRFFQVDNKKYWVNQQSSFAISYNIKSIRDIVKFDIIYFQKKFPSPKGERLNFKLNIEIPITDKIKLGYSHLSNGFGIVNKHNPGLDNFIMIVRF